MNMVSSTLFFLPLTRGSLICVLEQSLLCILSPFQWIAWIYHVGCELMLSQWMCRDHLEQIVSNWLGLATHGMFDSWNLVNEKKKWSKREKNMRQIECNLIRLYEADYLKLHLPMEAMNRCFNLDWRYSEPLTVWNPRDIYRLGLHYWNIHA